MNDFDIMNYGQGGRYNGNCSRYMSNQGYAPLALNEQLLLKLGVSQAEINEMKKLISYFGTVTVAYAKKAGYDPVFAKRLKDMYDLATGVKPVDSKSLNSLNGRIKKIGIHDLATSRLHELPRMAVIGNIPAGKFEMYNSKHYGIDGLYHVVETKPSKIVVKTFRKPVLKHRESKKLDGIIEITGVNSDGTINIEVNKQFIKLCNRFIIVASLKMPAFHYGMVEILCWEGTKIYIYAAPIKNSNSVDISLKGGTQRVYDFGFFRQEIDGKLMNTASIVYKNLKGVAAQKFGANMEFVPLDRDSDKLDDSNPEQEVM